MKIFKKITIIALIISNLIFIALFIFRPPHPPFHVKGNLRDEIITTLDFNQKQIKQYDELIKEHKNGLQRFEQTILVERKKIYNNLSNEAKPNLERFANSLENLERLHFNHFQAIRNLCSVKQQKKFDESIHHFIYLLKPKK